MKKALLIGVLFLVTFASIAKEVKIGVFVHAPHVYKNESNEEAYGPGVDYIKLVIETMGYKPIINLLPLQRIFILLQSGQLDLALEIAKTPDREEYLYYSETPTYVMIPSLTVLASNKLNEIKTISDLRKMKIGYLNGAIIPSFFNDSSTIVFDTISGESWIQQNLAKLIAGRIDGALDNNAYSYIEEAKKQKIENIIKTLPLPGEETRFYVVFSKASKLGYELVQEYNSLINENGFNEQKMIDEYLRK